MGPFKLIVLIFIPFTEAEVKKSGYYPVSACPKDANEWEASSRRLMCNNTHSYHCAPYHDRSQFYEFCYEMAVLEVKKGHCLGVAESGILNFDSCHFFSQGCPNEDYQSNEMYKYPSCLSIQENCYTEDCVCNCFTAAKRSIYRKDVNQQAEQNQNRYLIPFVICCIISVLSIILNVLQLIRSQAMKKASSIESICKSSPSLVLASLTECQLYFNCSMKHLTVSENMTQHLMECQYPELFSDKTFSCEPFSEVNCGVRKRN